MSKELGPYETNPRWWSPENEEPSPRERIERKHEHSEYLQELQRDAEAARRAEEKSDE